MWSGGATSSDWAAAGGDGEELGVDPNGVSGVLSLLRAGAAGVVVGLAVVVWLEMCTTGGEAGGVIWGSAGLAGKEWSAGVVGAESSARASGEGSSACAAASGMGLAGGVGMAMLIGMASARSIFLM
ncbi:hypothetical protein V6N13_100441 [Hibiscus sabdariffa]|uniref:Uncharacterized protein n=1 Tax=Hibiscus sabdariffa TaxID=183260 RepID=A0ABR2BTH3_9ROSI